MPRVIGVVPPALHNTVPALPPMGNLHPLDQELDEIVNKDEDKDDADDADDADGADDADDDEGIDALILEIASQHAHCQALLADALGDRDWNDASSRAPEILLSSDKNSVAGSEVTTPCFPVQESFEFTEGGTVVGEEKAVLGEEGAVFREEGVAGKEGSLSTTEQRRLLRSRRELESETSSGNSKTVRARRIVRHRTTARKNVARKSAIVATKRKKSRESREDEESRVPGGALFGGDDGDDECSAHESILSAFGKEGLVDYSPKQLNQIGTFLFKFWNPETRKLKFGTIAKACRFFNIGRTTMDKIWKRGLDRIIDNEPVLCFDLLQNR